MNNRQHIITIIKAKACQDLMSEINYQMEAYRDEGYDLADALYDVEDIAESEKDFAILKRARAIIIEAGGYIEMPARTDTGKDTRFIFKKKMYGWPHAGGWVTWIEEVMK